jgi:hypothetical protein
MATTTITLTINTPHGVSIADAIDLFVRHHNYVEEPGVSKADFAKRVIARQVSQAIKAQKMIDAEKATHQLEASKPEISVE